jgi:hypothetical protein
MKTEVEIRKHLEKSIKDRDRAADAYGVFSQECESQNSYVYALKWVLEESEEPTNKEEKEK